MRTFNIVILACLFLAAFIGGQTAQAQVHVEEILLQSTAGNGYFQLINSAGDSVHTKSISTIYSYNVGSQVAYDLFPDSMGLRYYSTNDSIISVTFGIRDQQALRDTGLWTKIGVDTATTPSGELQRRGYISIGKNLLTNGALGTINISIKAAGSGNATGNATLGKLNAAKLYVRLVLWYTLVK